MITRNEEKNLPRTLKSVFWADEIVIVDSGSV
ncbi:MAG TPA: glycosyltransferase, partial [Silvibacterium sp.]|nr:glycosyltransferase [Silvibacterium sp.]